MAQLFQGSKNNQGYSVPNIQMLSVKDMVPADSSAPGGTGTILRGTLTFDREHLKAINPAYTGYTHLFLINPIRFLDETQRLDANFRAEAAIHAKHFKFLIEHASLSYSGTPDLQLNTSDVNTGFSDRTVGVATSSSYDSNQFTISMLESYGEPLRRCIEFIIIGLSDPSGKYTHMYGSDLSPVTENQTFELLVVTTDQTLQNITDLTLWQAAFPTGIDRNNLDWEQGNIDIIQNKTVTFRGVCRPNAYHMKSKAMELLKARLYFYTSVRDADMTLTSSLTA